MAKHVRRSAVGGLVLVAALAGGAGFAAAQSAAELAAARAVTRDAVASYRAGDWATARGRFVEALRVQPGHPVWLYDVAAVSARMGDTATAVAMLDSVARLGFVFHPADDGDFAALRSVPEFRRATRALDDNATRIGAGEPFIRIPDVRFLPEGVAFDSATGSVFLASVHERRVVRVRQGTTRTFADSTAGLWSVLGMVAVPETRSLWLVTTVTDAMQGGADARRGTALVELDLDSGGVRRHVAAPSDSLAFNDLTVDEDGVVYISETTTNAVYRWTAAEGLSVLVPPGVIYNPSGLARMPGTEWLYVADYPVGMTRVSVRDGRVERLTDGPGVNVYGADGVVRWGRDLIVIQNAIAPHRVARLHLSGDGSRIESVEVLERASPWYAEPTLGVVAGGALLYVANSHWGDFRHGVYEGSADVPGPVVLRLPLAR